MASLLLIGNQGGGPNYEPNSFSGPQENEKFQQAPFKVTGNVQRYVYKHPNCDFSQPGTLFRKIMKPEQKTILIDNIVGNMKPIPRDIQERQVKIFYKCDPEYGNRVAQGLGFPVHPPKL